MAGRPREARSPFENTFWGRETEDRYFDIFLKSEWEAV